MNKKHDHTALLGEVKSEMPKDELLSDLADLFKILRSVRVRNVRLCDRRAS